MADTPLTISRTRVSPISSDESAVSGFTNKYTVKYRDIAYGTGSTDTVTLTLGTTPTNWFVDRAIANVTTAFAGTTALAVIVGTTSSTVMSLPPIANTPYPPSYLALSRISK